MAKLEERLRRELERIATPGDPAGVVQRVGARAAKWRVLRRVQFAALAVVVVAGTGAGIYALSRVFRAGSVSQIPIGAGITSAANGRIAFAQSTPDGMRLVSVNPDGSEPLEIPTPPGLPWLPAWSPDGTKLAVAIFPTGSGDRAIWIMNDDGSNARRIASANNVSQPSWSPDGTQIAYAGDTADGSAIHIVNADGSNDRIVGPVEPKVDYFSAAFSPDGSKILYDLGTDSGFDIFVMNADGSNVRRLTSTNADYDPHWSPDGTRIAFTRQGEGAQSDVYVMHADGSNVRQLTSGGSGETNLYPAWSPDGTKIAYLAGVDGGPGALVVMNPDGSDPVTLVSQDVLGLSWQPIPIGSAVEQSPTPGEDSLVTTPEPTPVLKGIGPVCNLSVVEGDFVGDGGVDTAFVYSKMPDVGGCQPPENGFQFLGVSDGTGDAVLTYGPLECEPACRTFAAPDVDQDGTSEILVVQVGFSILGLGLYDVGPAGEPGADGFVVLPVEVAPPGDPVGGFDARENVRFWLGGDAFELDALTCENGSDGRVLVATTAIQRPPDSPDSVWKAHETTFELRPGGELHVVRTRDFEEPVTVDAPSFLSGEELCGAPLGP